MKMEPTAAEPLAPPSPPQQSTWHSPVLYLFGWLSAMLGLIAFALVILASSYWKFSDDVGTRNDGRRDLEAGETDGGAGTSPAPAMVEEKYVVIMAGQEKPTCLATPIYVQNSTRASSFGSRSTVTCSSENRLLEAN